jgi:hypothetical protein
MNRLNAYDVLGFLFMGLAVFATDAGFLACGMCSFIRGDLKRAAVTSSEVQP